MHQWCDIKWDTLRPSNYYDTIAFSNIMFVHKLMQ